jgi:DNA-binding SARP family transcriptional activator/tRNA A-37 threonylcarbamoyl transferase component Bud32
MINLRLLGAVEVRDAAGHDITELQKRPKRIAVLAYLAAAQPPGFHRRDKLLGLYWAEASQQRARKALNQALHVLRGNLGKDTILSRGDGEVALNAESFSIDVRAFDAAIANSDHEEALKLYRGEFLDAFYVSDAPEFERWADEERSRLRQDALRAAFALVDRHEQAGNYLSAVERARWASRIAPADEVALRRLLKLLDKHGDRATALREYAEFVRRLGEDYGLDPSPETRALIERIRSRETPDPHELGKDRLRAPSGTKPSPGEPPGEPSIDTSAGAGLEVRLTRALAGRYRIEQEIASGGMATVFLAHELKHDRKVALKALQDDLSQSIGVDRFLREIRIEASLEHTNVVPLYESGDADGTPYYVMPYFEEGSLRDRLKGGRQLPLEEALRIMRDVADALDAAHRQGIVHRDIKPANIFFRHGRAVVGDFGIARALTEAGAAKLTVTGVAIGTPGYMSPEQATAEADLDGRTDQYSLACVVYEMLAGETVFSGPSARAIVAKHVALPPPPVRTVRPRVPQGVERAILRALEKPPVDRFATTGDFAGALEKGSSEAGAHEFLTGRVVQALAGLALIVTLVVAAYWIFLSGDGPSRRPLDPNKIIVFPFAATSQEANLLGVGWSVSLAIGGALEHAQPLKFLDGWRWLPETMRSDPRLITPEVEERISRERGARYYTSGVIRPDADSLAVVVLLQDVEGDSVIAQETVSGAAGAGAEQILGIRAISMLLPKLVEPGREIDLSPYTDRDLGAILLSIQGDRQYRNSRFGAALEFYERAVREDSLLAFAAVKGAQAASWLNQYGKGRQLIDAAMARDALLPSKYRHFARGWLAYLDGNADSAVSALSSALGVDPEWSEASMALGEVYYHLLPSEAPSSAGAKAAFEVALDNDSAFVPALFHLSEIAIRDGDTDSAAHMIRRVELAEPDTGWVSHLTVMRDCALAGSDEYEWQATASEDPSGALLAARSLAMGGAYPACARPGFEAVLRSPKATSGNRWAALMGLQSVLLAEGRHQEALALLDSAQSAGSRGVFSLFVLDAVAGAPLVDKAEEAEGIARQFTGEYYSSAGLATRWLLGTWSAQLRRDTTVRGIIRELQRAANGQEPQRVARYLEAHLAAARGEIDSALSRLEPLVPSMVPGTAIWNVTGALAPERILLADLLLAKGRYEYAERVASAFDHQEPVIFLVFLPRSLMLRLRAALASGRRAQVEEFRDRLIALGWADSVTAVLNR